LILYRFSILEFLNFCCTMCSILLCFHFSEMCKIDVEIELFSPTSLRWLFSVVAIFLKKFAMHDATYYEPSDDKNLHLKILVTPYGLNWSFDLIIVCFVMILVYKISLVSFRISGFMLFAHKYENCVKLFIWMQ
jgi:hypothetical protein